MNGKMLDITHILKIEKQILYKFTEPSPISEYSNIRKIRMLNDHWYRIIQCGLLMAAHKIKLLTSDLKSKLRTRIRIIDHLSNKIT